MAKNNEKLIKTIKIVENITATIRDAKTGKIKRIYRHKNTVQLSGRAVIARRLANETTYSGIINYGILCTQSPPVEYYRKLISSATYDDDLAKAYCSWFFSAPEVEGTFTQWRNVIDGTPTPGSGQEWTRVDVNWVKSNTETLTIDCIYTIISV